MGKSVIGILLSSGIWDISYRYSNLFAVDFLRERSQEVVMVSVTVEDVTAEDDELELAMTVSK